MKLGYLAAAVAVSVILGGAPGAFAFQLINPDNNTDGTTKFTDPDQQTQKLAERYGSSNSSTGTLKFGGSTLQFGMSGGNSGNYGASPALQERFLQSPASHTVPSQGW